MGSVMVMMHEVVKILYYAKAINVCCFRIGTCGGLGLLFTLLYYLTTLIFHLFSFSLLSKLVNSIYISHCIKLLSTFFSFIFIKEKFLL